MDITNEKSKTFGKYCGGPYRKDATAGVTGNYAKLNFYSDANLQNTGFFISFSTIPLPGKYKILKTISFHLGVPFNKG